MMQRNIWLLLLLVAAPLWPQASVTVFGTVKDPSGAAVPDAAVAITHVDTGAVRSVTTNRSGDYVASQLPVGTYRIRIEAAGFKSVSVENIATQVDENRRVDATLQVGNVAESIEVRAEATQVETRSGAIREVVDAKRIEGLPLNGRNALGLQYLVPGAGAITAAGQAQNASITINGARANAGNYQLDGADNQDPFFNTPSIFPNPDALEEFSVQTNAYGADRGRNAGAFLNAITRSGTNEFHGSVFEFLRNEKLNARNFFANSAPPFKRNQFGGTLGGPVRRDRTFFFGSYQRTTERSAPGAVTATVPTEAQRRGDFSAFGQPLRDPSGGVFANNQIPASRLNAASLKFLDAFVPLPTRPNGLLSFASQQKQDDDQYVVKIDHRLFGSNQLSGRLLHNRNSLQELPGNLPGFFALIQYKNWNLAVTDTHIFNPGLLNQFTFGYNDVDREQLSVVPGSKTWTDFGAGFVKAFEGDAPAAIHTQVDGYFNAFSRFPLQQFRHGWQFTDVVSITTGSHVLKIGGDLRRGVLNRREFFRGDPFLRFRATFTGEALADFMLGRPTQYEQIAENTNRPRNWEADLFIQDDWKVSRRFALNLGLRWDPYFAFTDELNRYAQVHIGQQSQVFPTAPLGVLFPGDPGMEDATTKDRLKNFAPRFGFAFDPTGKGTTSIRGGYGMFYAAVRQQANNNLAQSQPFSLRLTVNNPAGGVDRPYTGAPPFPFNPPQTEEERRSYRFITPLANAQYDPDFRNAIMQQWNLSVQRQLPANFVASIAYVGSKGNHLFIENELNPAIFGAPGNTFDARRPLAPVFASVRNFSSEGSSIYHSMQLSLNKRFSHGLTLNTNYTWSKLIDTGSGDGDAPANPFNIRNERAVSDLDLTHRFVASFLYDFPRLGAGPGLLRVLVNGWQTNGIITLQSGDPFTIVSGVDNSQSGIGQDRADLLGNPYLPADRPRSELISRYFNTAAFGRNVAGTFGNVGRNTMRGPGQSSVDFGLIREVTLHESLRLQFRAEAFNVLNKVNLGNPNAMQSSPNFGQITTAGQPRLIQLALRLRF
jgi:hypothetical protein